jgi:ornithine carbamoyltransferase
MNHLITLKDITTDEFNDILKLSIKLKDENKKGISHHLLKGKTLGMIFSKSSTRTRVSFEVGMYQLGGHALFLSSNDIQLGRGETIYDTANVMSRFIDGIMIRTFKQSDVEDLAKYGTIPIINGLTDLTHPCQALADFLTIYEEKKKLEGLKLCYVGDGNNVTHSLLYASALAGMNMSVATPKGFECDGEVVEAALSMAKKTGAQLTFTNDPVEAVSKADAVYTDTWVSMGQESEKEEKVKKFAGFMVDEKLMSHADSDAIFLHCLPAYRGYEVSEGVIDGKWSRVFDEAENRLHVQKAVMAMLMGDK